MNYSVFALFIVGLSQALAEELRDEIPNREKRHLLKKKLCFILGHCGNEHGGYGGHGGGYGGPGGGYGGYNGGYGGYPSPINIGISQSQSSSNAGGGGFGSGYYPNNYQYNGGYGGPDGQSGYGGPNGQSGHGGYRRPGYFSNGYGSNNNQFNGNYYGGNRRPQHGYGYQGAFDNYYDEGGRPAGDENEDRDYDDYGRKAAGSQLD